MFKIMIVEDDEKMRDIILQNIVNGDKRLYYNKERPGICNFMIFKKYLADRKAPILCFILLMMFMSLVIYLDGSFKVSAGNIFYINLVAFSFFMIYLVCSYLYNRSYYKSLNDIVENKRDEIINRLPKPKTYEQILISEVLSSLYDE
jgi:hypothetical protein